MGTTWPKICHRIWDPLEKFNEKPTGYDTGDSVFYKI